MDLINVFLLCLMSCIIGGVLMLLLQYVAFVKFFKAPHVETPHDRALNQEFAMPENIMCNVKSLDPTTKTSIIAFNLIFQFLFYEIRFSTGVRNWIYRKLTNELDELISKTTISKFFDKFLLRDLDLGSQFPEIKNMRVHNVELHDTEGHIESLDVVMDVHYRGNFKVAVDGHMLLGKKVFLAIKVKQLSGLARLQFTRKPYSHWSVCFIGDPALDLDIETLFQGRQLQLQPHLTGLLSHQIRKVVRRKHTLPTYKIRYKPFFSKFTEQFDVAGGAASAGTAPPMPSAATAQRLNGHLEVNVSELSRLAVPANANHVFCTVTLAAAPWSQVRQLTARTVAVTLVVRIQRAKNQQLGIQFKQRGIDAVYVDRLLPNTPALRADLLANDQLLSIGDRPVTNIGQVAKIIKAVAERVIVFRVERVLAGVVQDDSGCDEAFDEYEDMDDFPDAAVNVVAPATAAATTTNSKSSMPDTAAKVTRKNSTDRTAAPMPPASSDSSVANTPSSSPRKPSEPRESGGSLLSLGRKSSRATLKSSPSDASDTLLLQTRTSAHQSPPSTAAGSTEQLIADTEYQTAAAATPSSGDDAPASNEPPVVLRQHTTVNCLVNSLIKLNDLAHFQLTADSKWLNVCVYGRCNEDTELLGFVNIAVADILAESSQSSLWQLVKKFPLNAPRPMSMATHPLSNLKGFEPKLCFGDILMSFVWSGGIFEEDTGGKQPIPTDVVTPGTHDFLRTQFNRSTQCEYCGKKIWLKDAVQCRRCSMSCHKKCVKKCQIFTVCGATADGLTALSATSLGEQQNAAVPQTQRASVELRLTKSEGNNGGGGGSGGADGGSGSSGQHSMDGGCGSDAPNANCLMTGDQQQQHQQQQQQQQNQQHQQPSKNSFSDLLAQGIKRVNSVNNLSIPGMGQTGAQFTRSLPPSPQHTPRKQSLVNQSTNPFVAVVLTLEQMSDCVDDLEEEHIMALAQPLIGWGTAEELMGLAKTSSRSLYGDLEPNDRVDKINILLVRLRHVLDVETTYFAQLSAADARTAALEGGKFAVGDANDAADADRSPARRRPSNASLQMQSDEARKAFLVGQSEERVQALSFIMLHLCTGLQYAQGVATQ